MPLSFRIEQLKNLHRMFVESKDEILEALRKDLKKAQLEGMSTLFYKNEFPYGFAVSTSLQPRYTRLKLFRMNAKDC